MHFSLETELGLDSALCGKIKDEFGRCTRQGGSGFVAEVISDRQTRTVEIAESDPAQPDPARTGVGAVEVSVAIRVEDGSFCLSRLFPAGKGVFAGKFVLLFAPLQIECSAVDFGKFASGNSGESRQTCSGERFGKYGVFIP